MTGCARYTQNHTLLSGIGVYETIIPHKADGETVLIECRNRIRNKPEPLQIRIVSKWRRACDADARLLKREKPGIRQKLASLSRMVVAITLLLGPILLEPRDLVWPR